ncbi:MAG: stage V sporulation protein AD [Syntrophothermus sp.]
MQAVQTAAKKVGKQSITFQTPPRIVSTFTIVGPKEGQGPLGKEFDTVLDDSYYGETSWEKSEAKIVQEAVQNVIKRANLQPSDIDYVLAGDLLDQIISTNFGIRDIGIPFFGLYGACSTMAEALAMGSILVDGGYATRVIATASSHYNSAERQYRYPIELGVQRKPTSQWTVTGSGAALLAAEGQGPRVVGATIGKVVDMGVKDPNNMGTAMAPAAADTIATHLQDFGKSPQDYDLIVSGDLGEVGLSITKELLQKQKIEISDRFYDTGLMIFDRNQDVQAGASGAGCSAAVFCGHLVKEIKAGRYKRLLLVGTGALLSPVSYQQGESIPSIAHAVSVEM